MFPEEPLEELIKPKKPSTKKQLSEKAKKAREKEAKEDGIEAPPVKRRKGKA